MALVKSGQFEVSIIKEPSGEFVGRPANFPDHACVSGTTLNDAVADFSSLCQSYERECSEKGLPPRTLSAKDHLNRFQSVVSDLLEQGYRDLATQVLQDNCSSENPLVVAFSRRSLEEMGGLKD